jgi:hypothetical protein
VDAVQSIFKKPACGQTQRGATQKVGHDVWTFKERAPEDVIFIAQTTGLFRAWSLHG